MSAGRVLDQARLPGDWLLLRLETPLATAANPGHRLRLRLGERGVEAAVARVQADAGWLALLLRPSLGAELPPLRPHQAIDAMELTGEPFAIAADGTASVLLGSGCGIGAALFLAERLPTPPHLVILGGADGVPLRPRPSEFMVPGLPPATIAAAPSLEDRGIPSRIAHPDGLPGCFEGEPTELLHAWLAAQPPRPLRLYAAGPFGLEQAVRQATAGWPLQLQVRLFR